MNTNLPDKKYLAQIVLQFLILAIFITSPFVATAAGYTLLEPLPCVPGNGVTCTAGTQITSPDFETYVQYMFNLAIAIAAVSAVFMIVWGGFQYMTSEAPGVKSDGLKKVQNAVYGLLLVLSSFLILKTIDPRLVAIPSTLVKPLELERIEGYVPGQLGDFFNQIASEAANYRTQNLEVIERWKEEKVILEQLEKLKTELQNTLNTATNLNSQQKELLKAQIQNTDNKINDSVSKIILESAKSKLIASTAGSLDLGETSNPTTNTIETIERQKKLALDSYTKMKAELEKRNSSYVEVQTLKNTYFSIHGSFVLQENALNNSRWMSHEAITNKIDKINEMLSTDLPQITDQKKKTDLQANADLLITALNKLPNAEIQTE